jgi:hypothetical protein
MYHPGYSSYSHCSQTQHGSSSTDWQNNPASIFLNSSVYPLPPENPSWTRREVSTAFIPRDVLDKMRNGALPDRPPEMPVLPKKPTRKPVHSPTSSGSATRNSPQQQTSRGVSYRRDRTEQQTRLQIPQNYPPEGSYTARQAEEATLPDANSTRAPWRSMPDVSARNLSITRCQTPPETLQQRIVTAALSNTHRNGPADCSRLPTSRRAARLTAGVPESPRANDVRSEALVGGS